LCTAHPCLRSCEYYSDLDLGFELGFDLNGDDDDDDDGEEGVTE
jgi:hypothetical protein